LPSSTKAPAAASNVRLLAVIPLRSLLFTNRVDPAKVKVVGKTGAVFQLPAVLQSAFAPRPVHVEAADELNGLNKEIQQISPMTNTVLFLKLARSRPLLKKRRSQGNILERIIRGTAGFCAMILHGDFICFGLSSILFSSCLFGRVTFGQRDDFRSIQVNDSLVARTLERIPELRINQGLCTSRTKRIHRGVDLGILAHFRVPISEYHYTQRLVA